MAPRARLTKTLGHLARNLPVALVTAALINVAAPGRLSQMSPWPALLAWLAFAPILYALTTTVKSPRAAAALGLMTGLLVNGGLCRWFPGLMARFADINPALALLVTFALLLWQSLAWAVWAALVALAGKKRLPLWLVAPPLFVLLEAFWPMIFHYSLGLTQYQQLHLLQIAELTGPYGLTALIVLASAAIAESAICFRQHRRPPITAIALAITLTTGAILYGHFKLAEVAAVRSRAPTLRFAALQPDAARTGWLRPPDDSGALHRYQQTSAQLEATLDEPLDLLIWPEKAYPLLLRHDASHDYPAANRRRIRREFTSPLLFGVTSVDPETRTLRNSAAFLDSDGSLEIFYDKVRLILFSEWLPSWIAPWFAGVRYQPGSTTTPLLLTPNNRDDDVESVRVGVFICFESTFGRHIRALRRHDPALLVNLTDDAWFGDTDEPEQHLAHAVFRAVESRRDIIRATASGITAHISATGEILARLDINRRQQARWLIGEVRLLGNSH